MKKNNRIIIVDDHILFSEGLSFVISQMDGFEVVGVASDGLEFLEMINTIEVDITLMDISMPGMDGVTTTRKAIDRYPDIKIIALTMFSEKEYYVKMVNAGVCGFLLKESGKEELFRALNAVAGGDTYYSQKLLHNIILNASFSKTPGCSVSNQTNKLDPVEIEILKLVCQGLSTIQISEKLLLSLRTVEFHKSDLMKKSGAKNTINLAVYAVKNNLIKI